MRKDIFERKGAGRRAMYYRSKNLFVRLFVTEKVGKERVCSTLLGATMLGCDVLSNLMVCNQF
jgi:hypothetical protein